MTITRMMALLLVTTLSHAQSASDGAAAPSSEPPSSGTPEAAQTSERIEVFKGARNTRMEAPAYPESERSQGRDGWVILNFMIDPRGKPYELTVTDSTGNKELEKAAIRAAQRWEFEPATLDGVPIDSSTTMSVQFVLTGSAAGANAAFSSAYRGFLREVQAGDRAKADAKLAKMKVQNLYEDAFYNLALYQYARLWGTEPEQVTALRRALSYESYLPKQAYVNGLELFLALLIKRNDFGGAVHVWGRLTERADAATLARWESTIKRVEAFREDAQPYTVAGDFGDSSSWGLWLFRKNFRVDVSSGQLAEIKLRCDKRYVFFKFDPEIQYTVSDAYGACRVELIGDPGTKFSFVQS